MCESEHRVFEKVVCLEVAHLSMIAGEEGAPGEIMILSVNLAGSAKE